MWIWVLGRHCGYGEAGGGAGGGGGGGAGVWGGGGGGGRGCERVHPRSPEEGISSSSTFLIILELLL